MAEEVETNPKAKTKRNKRKKLQLSTPTNSIDNGDVRHSANGDTIEFVTTIRSIRRDLQQPHQHQQQKQKQQISELEGQQPKQQPAQKQQQGDSLRDEDENIAIDLEHQSVLFQVEKILSSTSGRSDLVFFIVRLKPSEPNTPVSCIYLGEAQKSTSILSDVTLRLNDRTIAHVPAERSITNSYLRTFGALATLQTSILYLRHREQIYIKLIEFYKRLLRLSRDSFQELRGLNAFWRQLHLLERYITNTSRFSFTTINPAVFAKRRNRSEKLKMVHEVGPHIAMGQSGVVNSTSLEDVPLSEASERAQSIQSLHSATDTPTPDGTPSYEELQQRLDEYNRHIEQMNEQKNQLMRMHNDAKQHLMHLEQYQQECNQRNLSFGEKSGQGNGSNDQPPDYNSVNEVQNDMNILSQRVQNITRIVNSQNQLVNQLPGEASEEMRADQANLEQKLKDLRKNGDDLRMMASELDTLNTNAIHEDRCQSKSTSLEDQELPKESATSGRIVPIHITSNELGSLKTIEQKESEIEAMKTQLRRLKDMMGTIESIEAKATSALQAGAKQSNARNVPIRAIGDEDSCYRSHDDDHERTPTPRNMGISDMARNLRLRCNGVSSDVRAQSERMDVEKERIMALQNEISRFSQQAAAAAQLGEDALKRNSLTPTPTPSSYLQQSKDSEESECTEKSNNDLKNVYLAKSQEYEEVCRRLQELHPANSETHQQSNAQENLSSVEHAKDILSNSANESDHNLENYESTLPTTAPVLSSNLTGSNLQDDMSAEASSMQTNSSNSYAFSIPPLMTTIGGGVSWAGAPHSWNYPNFRYTHPTTVISPTCAFPPQPPTVAVPPFVSAPPPPPPVSLSVLTGPNSTNGLFYNPSHPTPPGTVPTLPPPVLGPAIIDQTMLQHCINQQQMFSQALNQLSTMLWQQQRDIEYLHRITQTLQERLIRLGGEPILHGPDGLGLGFRSESVPPSFTAVAMSSRPPLNIANNNIFSNISNRAQSEQPLMNSTDGSNISQYQQDHQHHFVQQQQQQHHHTHHQIHQQRQFSSNTGANSGSTGTYSETQQHGASAAAISGGSSSIYSTLNNANVTGCNLLRSQVPSTTSGHETAQGPAPIFMHHHNNAIHQNNANLRRANVHAHTHTHTHGHANGASMDSSNNTLNNQVPPGNRANNYWDNFKSYSRQNLLGPQSSKSNEDNQQQQQQHQQYQEHQDLIADENSEYNPENPQLYPTVRRHAQILHRKCLHQITNHRLLNEPNIMDTTNRNSKDILLLENQPRIKNFQQHRRQQHPNPLPIGTIITNPLHANIPANDSSTAANTYVGASTQQPVLTAIPTEIFANSHQLQQSFDDYPVNEFIDDQITAEMYGCNYEHPSTSISQAITNTNRRNANERIHNVNFGNSPSNRRQGNKVAPKFQQCLGLLTEQSMRMIESFLDHWDDVDNEGNQEMMVLNNRQSIHRYLRQLHQLQSTLRFDSNYVGPTATSDYIDRQIYMRDDDYDEEPEDIHPLYEQSDNDNNNDNDDNDDDMESINFENVSAKVNDGDININRENSNSDRFNNINRSIFERNLLVNNRNARKPEKFIKKQSVSGASQRLSGRFDYRNDENRAIFSKSQTINQRRGSNNRMADMYGGQQFCAVEWNDRSQSEVKNVERYKESSTIRHALSDSNVTETHRSISEIKSSPKAVQKQQPIFKNRSIKIETKKLQQQNEMCIQKPSPDSEDNKITDYEPENPLDESSTCEDIDNMGAYSLAAQEHFQSKKAMLKGKSKQKDKDKDEMILMDKQKEPQLILEEETNSMEAINDDIPTSLAVEECTRRRINRSRKSRNGIRLDSECRTLINVIMACLRTDLKSIVFVDNTLLTLISKITASISQSALFNTEFPRNDESLALLSAERLLAKMQADIIDIPTRFAQFIPWYEKYLETLLIKATSENIQGQKQQEVTHKGHVVEFADDDDEKTYDATRHVRNKESQELSSITASDCGLKQNISDECNTANNGTNDNTTETNEKSIIQKKTDSQNIRKTRRNGKRNQRNRSKR